MSNAPEKAEALKASYVDTIAAELRAPQQIASGHMFLNEGKTGYMNDNDPGLYLHREQGTQRIGEDESLRMPVQGGKKAVEKMKPSQKKQFNQIYDHNLQPPLKLA